MGYMKHLIKFVIFSFAVVTLVGMGFLTRAVLGITTDVKCYPSPATEPTSAPVVVVVPQESKSAFNDIRSFTIIDLNQEQIVLAKMSVVCFWIFISIAFIKLII
jgi:hypothetical protein